MYELNKGFSLFLFQLACGFCRDLFLSYPYLEDSTPPVKVLKRMRYGKPIGICVYCIKYVLSLSVATAIHKSVHKTEIFSSERIVGSTHGKTQ